MKKYKSTKNTGLFVALILFTFSVMSQDKFPQINDYWLRAAPPNAMMQAAYAELINTTGQDIKLISAYSPAFKMTQIHKTIITDGIAKMKRQPELLIEKDSSLKFEPGGLHIMLMHPIIKFQQGDSIKINLIYSIDGKRLVDEIWFPVEKK